VPPSPFFQQIKVLARQVVLISNIECPIPDDEGKNPVFEIQNYLFDIIGLVFFLTLKS